MTKWLGDCLKDQVNSGLTKWMIHLSGSVADKQVVNTFRSLLLDWDPNPRKSEGKLKSHSCVCGTVQESCLLRTWTLKQDIAPGLAEKQFTATTET